MMIQLYKIKYIQLKLQPLDDDTKERLNVIKDKILYRFEGTGVWKAVQTAVETLNPIKCYPVRSFTTYSSSRSAKHVFGACFLVKPGTTIRKLAFISFLNFNKYILII